MAGPRSFGNPLLYRNWNNILQCIEVKGTKQLKIRGNYTIPSRTISSNQRRPYQTDTLDSKNTARTSRLWALAVSLPLFAGVWFYTNLDNHSDKYNSLQLLSSSDIVRSLNEQLQEKEKEALSIKAKLISLENERKSLQDQVKTGEEKLKELGAEFALKTEEIKQSAATISSSQQRVHELSNQTNQDAQRIQSLSNDLEAKSVANKDQEEQLQNEKYQKAQLEKDIESKTASINSLQASNSTLFDRTRVLHTLALNLLTTPNLHDLVSLEKEYIEAHPIELPNNRSLTAEAVNLFRLVDAEGKTRALILERVGDDNKDLEEANALMAWVSERTRSLLAANQLSKNGFAGLIYSENWFGMGDMISPLRVWDRSILPSIKERIKAHTSKSGKTKTLADILPGSVPRPGYHRALVRAKLYPHQKLDTEGTDVMVDTGASVTLIDRSLIPPDNATVLRLSVPVTLAGFNGSMSTVSEVVQLTLTIEGERGESGRASTEINTLAYVMDGLGTKLILGLDTLGRAEATVDVGKRTLRIKDTVAPLDFEAVAQKPEVPVPIGPEATPGAGEGDGRVTSEEGNIPTKQG
ncbi:hypothetical protein M501DRAFT_1012659 [Patellaria atrata CBS 101060]|uniref:Uncharacterized protein n=1 Tax=Patellaria atrata CBS 101060 TaxID=1346257 RepID=A0A9P4SIT7_9PEZI|nr:hypothetical protein M501DRAFT_1012659 [Patellaria atrata CBS 101060]